MQPINNRSILKGGYIVRYIFIDTLFPECEPVELNEYEIDSIIDNGDDTHTIINSDGLVFIAKDLKKEV